MQSKIKKGYYYYKKAVLNADFRYENINRTQIWYGEFNSYTFKAINSLPHNKNKVLTLNRY